MPREQRRRRLAPLAFLCAALAGPTPVLAQGAAPGPLPVSVATPSSAQVSDMAEFTGRFEASAMVEVRSQVTGQLMEVAFKDGAQVKKGDLLFKIDPRPYQNALDSGAGDRHHRQRPASRSPRPTSTAPRICSRPATSPTRSPSSATRPIRRRSPRCNPPQAQVATAKLNLEWTDIRAPIDGSIGRKIVTEGNLVASGAGAAVLTTIVAVKPIYFYFDVDEQSYLRYMAYVREGQMKQRRRRRAGRDRAAEFDRVQRSRAASTSPTTSSTSRPARCACARPCRTQTAS